MHKLALGMGLALAAGPAWAVTITYSNTLATADNYNASYSASRASWEGAILSQKMVTFEEPGVPVGFANGSVVLFDTSNSAYSVASNCLGATASQACFARYTGSNSRYITNGEPPVPSPNNFFRGLMGATNYIQVMLPGSTTAVALDLYTIYSPGQNTTVTLYAADNSQIGQWTVPTTGNSTAGFFGARSDTVIAYVRISSAGGDPILDRIDFAAANMTPPPVDTPESATLGYLGIGLSAILFGMLKRK
ncbi:MAG: hypothetical protein HY235_21290 [Acidobacteria bacterium]|nr:hypothetical protein [Acidobacteriota bacterium]